MARWLVLVVLACGCRQIWGLGGTPDLVIDAATTPDVPIDVPADASLCFGSFGDAPYCLDAAPTMPLQLTSATNINTQNSTLCSALFTAECVIPATDIEIDADIAVIGNRPLVLIATGTMHVGSSGLLDAASHRAGNHGAASNPSICDNGNGPGAAGGGQGGSFGGLGGDGGKGEQGGGNAGNAMVPVLLQGGCPGGQGGSGGGGQGSGGGVIYVIAVDQILVDGAIDASGSAGNAASGNIRGGGGGGSGGMIVVESRSIIVNGAIFANGASGGGGASLSGNGSNGQDPIGVTSVSGGQGGALSGGGGTSSGLAMPAGGAGFDAPGNGGGGGGGGGAGVIKAIGSTISNQLGVSPAPS